MSFLKTCIALLCYCKSMKCEIVHIKLLPIQSGYAICTPSSLHKTRVALSPVIALVYFLIELLDWTLYALSYLTWFAQAQQQPSCKRSMFTEPLPTKSPAPPIRASVFGPVAQHAVSHDMRSSCPTSRGGPGGSGHWERLPHHVGEGGGGAQRHAHGGRRGHHQPLGILAADGHVSAPAEQHGPVHEVHGAQHQRQPIVGSASAARLEAEIRYCDKDECFQRIRVLEGGQSFRERERPAKDSTLCFFNCSL